MRKTAHYYPSKNDRKNMVMSDFDAINSTFYKVCISCYKATSMVRATFKLHLSPNARGCVGNLAV